MTEKHFMQAKADEQLKKKKTDDNIQESEVVTFDQGPTSEAVQRALQNPTTSNLTPAVVTALQRSHGNQFVAQLARQQSTNNSKLSAPIQMKMSVTAANDMHEQEADSVAKDVVSKINSGEVQREQEQDIQAKRIQREDMEEEEVMMQRIQREDMEEEEVMMKRIQRDGMEEELQMKPIQRDGMEEELQMKRIQREDMEEEVMMKRIQRVGSEDGFDVSSDIEGRIENSRGAGSAMDDNTRSNMEGAFGADFSNVRIHTGSEAADLTNAVQARAFTTGSDIYFNEGESPNNQELLAHELTHTIQQGAVAQTQRKEQDTE